MEKTITLTSDEISSITLAIYDKVMNLSQTVLICEMCIRDRSVRVCASLSILKVPLVPGAAGA